MTEPKATHELPEECVFRKFSVSLEKMKTYWKHADDLFKLAFYTGEESRSPISCAVKRDLVVYSLESAAKCFKACDGAWKVIEALKLEEDSPYGFTHCQIPCPIAHGNKCPLLDENVFHTISGDYKITQDDFVSTARYIYHVGYDIGSTTLEMLKEKDHDD